MIKTSIFTLTLILSVNIYAEIQVRNVSLEGTAYGWGPQRAMNTARYQVRKKAEELCTPRKIERINEWLSETLNCKSGYCLGRAQAQFECIKDFSRD